MWYYSVIIKDLENWYTCVFSNSRGVLHPTIDTKNQLNSPKSILSMSCWKLKKY